MADPNSRDRYFDRFDWYLKEHWNPEEPEQTNMIVRHANTRLFLTPPPRERAAVGDLDLLGIDTTNAARLPTGGSIDCKYYHAAEAENFLECKIKITALQSVGEIELFEMKQQHAHHQACQARQKQLRCVPEDTHTCIYTVKFTIPHHRPVHHYLCGIYIV